MLVLTLKPACSTITDMKLYMIIIAFLIGAISASGCAKPGVADTRQRLGHPDSDHRDEIRPPKQPPPAVSAQPATEILNKAEQLELLAHAFDAVNDEADKQALLLELIGNVNFNCDAKMAILERLKEIRDAEIRRSILQAFHRRGSCVRSK